MAKHITDVSGQTTNVFVVASIGTRKPSKGRYAGKTCHDVITMTPATRKTKGSIMLKADDIAQLHEYIQRNLSNGLKTIVYKSNKNHALLLTMLRFDATNPPAKPVKATKTVASKSIEEVMAEAEAENAKRDEQSIKDAMIEAEARNAEFDAASKQLGDAINASDDASPSLRKALLTEPAKHGFKAVPVA